MSYFFHPDARVEHLEHIAFYESRQRGLGGRYLNAFESSMVQVCATPNALQLNTRQTSADGGLQVFPITFCTVL